MISAIDVLKDAICIKTFAYIKTPYTLDWDRYQTLILRTNRNSR